MVAITNPTPAVVGGQCPMGCPSTLHEYPVINAEAIVNNSFARCPQCGIVFQVGRAYPIRVQAI